MAVTVVVVVIVVVDATVNREFNPIPIASSATPIPNKLYALHASMSHK